MKIASIETIPVLVPINPARAIKGSSGYHTHSPFLIVKVHTDEGLVGLGEVSSTPFWSGEDHYTAAHFIETILAPLLIGQNAAEIDRLTAVMNSALPHNVFTRSGIEMALWDIAGKSVGAPVYQLLGGKVREFVPTKFSISGLDPARSAEIAQWAHEQGFHTMKVKVGMDVATDIDRVAAVRDAVGPDVRLGVDANGGWCVEDAIEAIGSMKNSDIFFAEQPVAGRDLEGMAAVRSRVDIPIVADESVFSAGDAREVIKTQAADVLSVYVGKGGIGEARQIAEIAAAAGLTCTVGSNLELGVAAAAMTHLATVTPAIDAETYPCDILTPFYYEHSLVRTGAVIAGGRALPGIGPGLGVELDEEAIDRYRV